MRRRSIACFRACLLCPPDKGAPLPCSLCPPDRAAPLPCSLCPPDRAALGSWLSWLLNAHARGGRGVSQVRQLCPRRRSRAAAVSGGGVSALSVSGSGGMGAGWRWMAWARAWQMQSYLYPTIVSGLREPGGRRCGRGGGGCSGAFSKLSP
jgi:hypothetical protein